MFKWMLERIHTAWYKSYYHVTCRDKYRGNSFEIIFFQGFSAFSFACRYSNAKQRRLCRSLNGKRRKCEDKTSPLESCIGVSIIIFPFDASKFNHPERKGLFEKRVSSVLTFVIYDVDANKEKSRSSRVIFWSQMKHDDGFNQVSISKYQVLGFPINLDWCYFKYN